MRKQFKGFSLIEVAIAVSILIVAAGTLLTTFSQSSARMTEDFRREIAYNLAREKLEEYSRIPLAANEINLTEDYNSIADYPNFKRVVNISDHLYVGDLKQIRVGVFWNSDRDNFQAETLKASY